MPKRKRLFHGCNRHLIKRYCKYEPKQENENLVRDKEVSSARGRFKGALMDVLDPIAQSDNESEHSTDASPSKRERRQSQDNKEYMTDEEAKKAIRKSPPRQSYVLKLFDRSVDLSQFRDDSPLYPICRAWMVNQPKANYTEPSDTIGKEPECMQGSVKLPGPEGPPVPKIPALLPEQLAADKNSINLNYRTAPPPSREQLLQLHLPRWAAIKQAWQEQIVLKEARYESTQRVLNRINLEYPSR